MISVPTLFILGAGASQPYGFPIGEELVNIIHKSIMKGPDGKLTMMYAALNRPWNDVKNFAIGLKQSQLGSIDAYLENNPDDADIGKIAIASTLLPLEEPEKFTIDEGNWLRYLYREKLNGAVDNFGENKMSFISFNYDRSVEQFFYNALKFSHKRTPVDEIVTQIQKIPFIHVYGKLGPLDWQSTEGIPYGDTDKKPEEFHKWVRSAADNIKIFSEKTGEEGVFAEAMKLIYGAHKIYILGFGYHQINIKRLGLNEVKQKEIKGTSKGKTRHEVSHISIVRNEIVKAADLHDLDCYDFLRNIAELQ